MPIYEYQCDGCHQVFEVTQKMSDPPLKKHDDCGSKKVKKLISRSSFQLKGSGWYVTDYANKGAVKSDEKGDEKSASESGDGKADKETVDKNKVDKNTTAESKSDSKAEPKADSKEPAKKEKGDGKKKKSGEKAA